MSRAVEKVVEKISAYGLLNHLIPGAVYIALVERLTLFKVGSDNVLAELVLFYFAGVVIGRIGSLFVERVALKKVETISHEEFTEAEVLDTDGKVTTLSTVNNMYRTFVSAMVCLVITIIADCIRKVIPANEILRTGIILLICIGLAWLFLKSYQKQTGYVVSRAREILQMKMDEKSNNQNVIAKDIYKNTEQK